jgi:hypothetical protein
MGAVMIPTSYLTRDSYRRSFEEARPAPARGHWLARVGSFILRVLAPGRA